MSQRKRTAWTLGLFLMAAITPAFQLADDRVAGWQTVELSFIGAWWALLGTQGLLTTEFQSVCIFGTSAHLALLGAIVNGLRGRSRLTAQWAAAALIAASISIALLVRSNSPFTPLVGCGLWLVGILWLTVGSAAETAGKKLTEDPLAEQPRIDGPDE